MTAPHPDFLTVLEAVTVLSPMGYSFRGEPREHTPAPGADPPPAGPAFLPMLEGELYARLYTRPSPTGAPADFLTQRDHIAALSAANAGEGSWEPGWQVTGPDPAIGRGKMPRKSRHV